MAMSITDLSPEQFYELSERVLRIAAEHLRDLSNRSIPAKGSGAEIEQIVISSVVDAYSENRALTEDDLHRVISTTVPLSVTMEEQIKAIKSWAHDRALNASR